MHPILSALLFWSLYSTLMALLNYPCGQWAGILRGLARLSLLRLRDSPGTLHLPGTAQPSPTPVLQQTDATALLAPAISRWHEALLQLLPAGGSQALLAQLVRQAGTALRLAMLRALEAALDEAQRPAPVVAARVVLPEVPDRPPSARTGVIGVLIAAALLGVAACATLLSQGTEADTLHAQASGLQAQLLTRAEVVAAGLHGADRQIAVEPYVGALTHCLDESAEAQDLYTQAQEARARSAPDPLLEAHADSVLAVVRRDCAAEMAAAQRLLVIHDGGHTADGGTHARD